MDDKYLKKINKNLLGWFAKNKRNLPFRSDRDPYKILISEIMAQQTQISTMLPYFNRFIEKFPTVKDLAESSEEDVLAVWEGLGYYSRAKNLRKAAIEIESKGEFPQSFDELKKLPGVGSYTAGALASIAFGEKVGAVDGNALRVFSRIYQVTEDITKNTTKKKIEKNIDRHLKLTDSPGLFNEAVMEIGALVCTKKNPACENCPVCEFCLAYKNNLTNILPVREKAPEKKTENYDVLIPLYRNEPLYQKRVSAGILSNLYGFPMIDNEGSPGKKVTELAEKYNLDTLTYLGESKHSFTHKIWVSSVFIGITEKPLSSFTLTPPSVPTAFKKMLKLFS